MQSGAPFEFSDPELKKHATVDENGKQLGEACGVDYSRPAPELGEHTDEILQNYLGYSEAATTALRDSGIIR